MKSIELNQDTVRRQVRTQYSKIAERGTCGCAPTCCNPAAGTSAESGMPIASTSQKLGYSIEDTSAVPDGANLGLGCGNPLAIASLKPGQTVVDLGSGAGFDAFLAAKAVGPAGSIIGVDMTPEMISKARKNKAAGDFQNVEFRLGEIENLPVADNSVHVIISNCVINLSPDKAQVFREAFRVLKAGGRLAVSDLVALKPLPAKAKEDIALYAGCVAGTSSVDDLKAMLRRAGFADVRIEVKPQSRDFIRQWFPNHGIEDYIASASIEAVKPQSIR